MSLIFESTDNTRLIMDDGPKYIRSDVPTRVSEKEREWLLRNKATLVVDLRTDDEREAKPCPLEADSRFDYRVVPLSGGDKIPHSPDEVSRSYIRMADEKLALARNLILTSPGALYFCNAGKDRTGVLSAAILCKLGFDTEYIVADYMRSRDNLEGRLTAYANARPEVDIEVITPHERYIKEFLLAYKEKDTCGV